MPALTDTPQSALLHVDGILCLMDTPQSSFHIGTDGVGGSEQIHVSMDQHDNGLSGDYN